MLNTLEAQEKVRTIWSWDLHAVQRRVMKDTGMKYDDVMELTQEYRRYLICIVANPGTEVPVSEPVDRLWHVHMLFTQDYDRLARTLFPETGIRHTPTLTEEEEAAILPQYQAVTLPTYNRLFGQPPTRFWPLAHCVCLGSGGWGNCA